MFKVVSHMRGFIILFFPGKGGRASWSDGKF
jgi:hypothetical protein